MLRLAHADHLHASGRKQARPSDRVLTLNTGMPYDPVHICRLAGEGKAKSSVKDPGPPCEIPRKVKSCA